MKILMLDFDGVIVTAQSLVLAQKKNLDLDQCLDPIAVANLNYICQKVNDLKIVISSGWRIDRTLEELKELLARNGMAYPHRVIGTTPILRNGSRDEEIRAWLEEYRQGVTAFAIIDDLPVVDTGLRNFWVQTDPKLGLLRSDIQKIIAILEQSCK